MTSTVRQNADNAAQANQLALAARDQAENSGTVVRRAVKAMADQARELTTNMGRYRVTAGDAPSAGQVRPEPVRRPERRGSSRPFSRKPAAAERATQVRGEPALRAAISRTATAAQSADADWQEF